MSEPFESLSDQSDLDQYPASGLEMLLRRVEPLGTVFRRPDLCARRRVVMERWSAFLAGQTIMACPPEEMPDLLIPARTEARS